MFLERDPLPTPIRRTGDVRNDKLDRHDLDTVCQIRQALAWLGVGEALGGRWRAWLEQSLGALAEACQANLRGSQKGKT